MTTSTRPPPAPLIELRGLSTVFGPRPGAALAQADAGADKAALLAQGHTLALHGIDLDIHAGEIFVIMGRSGSGKSTLLRHLNRLVEPTAGSVHVAGQDVRALSHKALIALRRERMAMVFQGFGLLGHRRVIDNVAFGLALRGVPRAERHAKARHWLAQVGLEAFAQHAVAQLSGGMQQRVGLARALCSETDILLMDEPFAALDPVARVHWQGRLLALQAGLGRTIVFITHDLDEALRIGSRVALLQDGRLLQVGTPRELVTRPAGAQVADFMRDVNRARALRVADALTPWPTGMPVPPLDEAVEAAASLEAVLPRLLGEPASLAVQQDSQVVGQVSRETVRRLLAGPR